MEPTYGQLEECLVAYMDTHEGTSPRQGERPKVLKNRGQLVSEYEEFAQTHMQNHTPKFLVISHYYTPSVASYQDLEKIMIKDLALETNHRGCYLLLRFICAAVRLSAVTNIAEDEAGNVITFMLNLPDAETIRPAKIILKKNSVIILKEPFFKISVGGESYAIQVDHPTDIVWLSEDDARVPLKWRAADISVKKPAEHWKKQGNDLVGQGNFFDAIDMYSRALRSSPTPEEQEVLHNNRALVNLRIGAYDAAIKDASFVANPDVRSEKALHHGALALYGLGRYAEALELLQILADKCPNFAPAKSELHRTSLRLVEQKTGIYNFKAMYEAGKLGPRMDNASYKDPVEVRHSKGRGRGLFSTKVVKAGELLLCEKAFSYCFDFDASAEKMAKISSKPMSQFSAYIDIPGSTKCIGIQTNHIHDIANKLILNPSLKPSFEDLFNGEYEGVKGVSVDGGPVVDTFLVAKTMLKNCFACPSTSMWASEDKESKWQSTGVWILASYINHSCHPNSVRCFIGDMIIIRAARDMPAGTEVTIAYIPPVEDEPGAIHERLDRSWGFACDCVVCTDDCDTPAGLKTKRTKLIKEFRGLTSKCSNPNGNTYRQLETIKKKEAILTQIEKTYRRPPSEVPRVLLWDLYSSLALEIVEGAGYGIIIKRIIATFESSGFVIHGVDLSSSRVVVDQWGFPNSEATALWLTLRNVYKALGKYVLAEQAKELAKITWALVMGEDDTFNCE